MLSLSLILKNVGAFCFGLLGLEVRREQKCLQRGLKECIKGNSGKIFVQLGGICHLLLMSQPVIKLLVAGVLFRSHGQNTLSASLASLLKGPARDCGSRNEAS